MQENSLNFLKSYYKIPDNKPLEPIKIEAEKK